jgi:ketosteroid isomerase-like protein
MEEHPNVTKVREWAEKMDREDYEAAMGEALADDVEWHEIGRSEPTRGKAAMAQRMQQSMGSFEMSGDTHDIVGNDQHVVQLLNVTAKKPDGQTLNYRTAEIYHMKDGKITARWAFSDDTAAILEFFGQS